MDRSEVLHPSSSNSIVSIDQSANGQLSTNPESETPTSRRFLRASHLRLDGILKHVVKSRTNKVETILSELIKEEHKRLNGGEGRAGEKGSSPWTNDFYDLFREITNRNVRDNILGINQEEKDAKKYNETVKNIPYAVTIAEILSPSNLSLWKTRGTAVRTKVVNGLAKFLAKVASEAWIMGKFATVKPFAIAAINKYQDGLYQKLASKMAT